MKGEYPAKCEMPMHELQLNKDSSFSLKLYCYGDSLSLLKPTFQTGNWSRKNDSLLNFVCSNKTTFEAKLFNGSIQVISNKHESYIPTFQKKEADTIK